jgi:hypothetical protein
MNSMPTWLIDQLKEKLKRQKREQENSYEQLRLPLYEQPIAVQREQSEESGSRIIILEL